MSVNDYRTPQATEIFEVKQGPHQNAATFIFGNEDHTLGNSLRYLLSQNKNTEFVGYSVPHPYEPKMNLRLQTVHDTSVNTLKKSLKELEELANILDDKFCDALERYEANISNK